MKNFHFSTLNEESLIHTGEKYRKFKYQITVMRNDIDMRYNNNIVHLITNNFMLFIQISHANQVSKALLLVILNYYFMYLLLTLHRKRSE